jgi:predicted nucleic acid-binding protein
MGRYTFDTEPIIAYLRDEEGADHVEALLEEIARGESEGFISPVTKTEVLSVSIRAGLDKHRVMHFLTSLESIGIETPSIDDCWYSAAMIKAAVSIALGDAFALATAAVTTSTLIVGADDDFTVFEGEWKGTDIERIRTESA